MISIVSSGWRCVPLFALVMTLETDKQKFASQSSGCLAQILPPAPVTTHLPAPPPPLHPPPSCPPTDGQGLSRRTPAWHQPSTPKRCSTAPGPLGAFPFARKWGQFAVKAVPQKSAIGGSYGKSKQLLRLPAAFVHFHNPWLPRVVDCNMVFV